MLQAFIIMLREGFEGFLICAIILAYLRKCGDEWLMPAVYWGVLVSVLVSAALGYVLRDGLHMELWEGILGVVTIILVGSLIIQMWKMGSRIKSDMENKLQSVSSQKSKPAVYWGIFLFTVLMITREGMETAVMLIQVRQGQFVLGAVLGTLAAAALAFAWTKFSALIDLKRFFQVTGIFLLLFLVQVAIYSIHEFSEAGILPNSDWIHIATEQFSPDGLYGKWFSLLIVATCAVWLLFGWISDKSRKGVL